MGCGEGLTIPYGAQGTLPEGPRGPDMELVSGSFEHDSSCSLGPDNLSCSGLRATARVPSGLPKIPHLGCSQSQCSLPCCLYKTLALVLADASQTNSLNCCEGDCSLSLVRVVLSKYVASDSVCLVLGVELMVLF